MAASRTTQFRQLLETLTAHGVEFLVVGGVAAILEGAPVVTQDLDVLVEPSQENLERLLQALQQLGARFRDPAGRHILPDAERLAANRLNLFETDLGLLDVLREVGHGRRFDDLEPRSSVYRIGETAIRVLQLAAVIETKQEANRDKDRATLPVLLRTLEAKRAGGR